jgi:hypothetical protein
MRKIGVCSGITSSSAGSGVSGNATALRGSSNCTIYGVNIAKVVATNECATLVYAAA